MNQPLTSKRKNYLLSNLQIALAFLVCFVGINPVFISLNIKGTILLTLWFIVTLATNKLKISIGHFIIYILFFLYILTSLLVSVVNITIMPLLMSIFITTTVLIVLQLDEVQLGQLLNLTTKIFLFFVIGALIGIIYFEIGGKPLIILTNPDGRDNALYLTTFSNAETFTIRPSAVFDEPGAFSFFICVLVALRSRLRLSLPASYLLLLGGLLTQSIAHLFFIILWTAWLVSERQSKDGVKKNKSVLIGLIIFISIVIFVISSGFLDWAFERGLMYYLDTESNPRFNALIKIIEHLSTNSSNLWFGFNIECIQRQSECGGMGENPLTPLIYGGLFVAWPYYLFIVVSFFSIFYSRDGLLLLGISVLLLQRPYLLEFPYSALLALVYLAWILKLKKK